jgi:uncharacterized membrane protein
MEMENIGKCAITGKSAHETELVTGLSLRKSLIDFIKQDHPGFGTDSLISSDALRTYRRKYLTGVIEREMGQVSKVEKEVIDSISKQEIISENVDAEDEDEGVGSKLADRVAGFGGSWTFILIFIGIIICWMILNTWMVAKPFDPFPYILLNLILSCLAAFQAPIIMMSQNRQEAKDRRRAEYDYKVNLKAELEIRMLHEKVDHLMVVQTQHIIELQQIQLDYLEDISAVVIKQNGSNRNNTQDH